MSPQPPKPDKPHDPPGRDEAQVTIEDGDEPPVHKTVPAVATPVADLLVALGLAGDLVLWVKRHGKREVVDIHQPFTPANGDHFIAVRGGGVS
jgi:hypothetical protein